MINWYREERVEVLDQPPNEEEEKEKDMRVKEGNEIEEWEKKDGGKENIVELNIKDKENEYTKRHAIK